MGRLGKAAYKSHSDWTLANTSFFLKTIYNNRRSFPEGWACLSLCHYRKHKAPMMMRQNRRILCIQGDSGPAGCTLLLHSSASHITPFPSTIPVQAGMDQGWRVHGEAAFSLLCSVLLLFQICISSFAPLSLPIFPLFRYFPSLKTSPSFLISVKCSLWRVKFILFNVLLLDKHLWTAICLAEVLFPFDTGRQPASCFL